MKKMKQKVIITIVGIFFLSLMVLAFAGPSSGAAQYPSKPITLIMVWPAGGGTDTSLRPLVAAASKILRQPIVIEYHPGGNGAVGMEILRLKKGDGYTIGCSTASVLVNPYLRKVQYDSFKDFTWVIEYADQIAGLAVPANAPWKTMQEFLDYAKANPGKIRYSSSGPGCMQALPMDFLGKKLGIKWTHIPFEGGPPALVAVLGGHVEAYATTMHCKSHMQPGGRLRLLSIFGNKRNPSFPDVPTLQEVTGLGDDDIKRMDGGSPQFILAPKGLSPDILEALHQAFKKAMTDPDFIKACEMMDHAINYRGPEQATKYFQELDQAIAIAIRELKEK